MRRLAILSLTIITALLGLKLSWHEANTVRLTLINKTDAAVSVSIVQQGNHHVHFRHELYVEKDAQIQVKLKTRIPERSIVTITDVNHNKVRFLRPNGSLGFFRSELYTIDSELMSGISKQVDYLDRIRDRFSQ